MCLQVHHVSNEEGVVAAVVLGDNLGGNRRRGVGQDGCAADVRETRGQVGHRPA